MGIPITSVIFGAMHAGYANGYELLFSVAGVFLGVACYKTRDLALVVTIHAVNNIALSSSNAVVATCRCCGLTMSFIRFAARFSPEMPQFGLLFGAGIF